MFEDTTLLIRFHLFFSFLVFSSIFMNVLVKWLYILPLEYNSKSQLKYDTKTYCLDQLKDEIGVILEVDTN